MMGVDSYKFFLIMYLFLVNSYFIFYIEMFWYFIFGEEDNLSRFGFDFLYNIELN